MKSIFSENKRTRIGLPNTATTEKWRTKKKTNKGSVSQIKVQVMTINSVQVSSKSELSSTTFGHFKVYAIYGKFPWPHLGYEKYRGPPLRLPPPEKCQTLTGSKVPKDSSDFDETWTELIVMTWTFILATLRFFSVIFCFTPWNRGWGVGCVWEKFKFNVNQNANKNKNPSGGTRDGGAKRPSIGCFTHCVFVFVLIYVEFEFSESIFARFFGDFTVHV